MVLLKNLWRAFWIFGALGLIFPMSVFILFYQRPTVPVESNHATRQSEHQMIGLSDKLTEDADLTVLTITVTSTVTRAACTATPSSQDAGLAVNKETAAEFSNHHSVSGPPAVSDELALTASSLNFKDLLFNYSLCPQSRPFKVYFYNEQFPELLSLKDPLIIDELRRNLDEKESITSDPSEACVFMAIVGPLKETKTVLQLQSVVHSLPYWSHVGVNHVLIDFAESESVASSPDLLSKTDTGSAVIASSHSNSGMDSSQHIIISPVLLAMKQWYYIGGVFHYPASVYPSTRNLFLYFGGQYVAREEDTNRVAYRHLKPVSELLLLQQSLLSRGMSFVVEVQCGIHTGDYPVKGEWALCHSSLERSKTCLTANFSLVLGGQEGQTGSATYTRLVEALQCGAVPVVVGLKHLPFGEIINWHRAAVILQSNMLLELPHFLSSLDTDTIMNYRKQGKFLYNTYFKSALNILETVIAIMRFKAFHLPPVAKDFNAKLLLAVKASDTVSKTSSSQTLNNRWADVYTEKFWNSPPSPFYIYPTTPFKPPSLTSVHKPAASTTWIGTRWGTRRNFHGDYADEGFTIVTITYNRTPSLLKMIERFRGCPSLVKVVVVWNGEDIPPPEREWPQIGVPIEVVSAGINSLNNRFLPLSNIETDAVLSMDDDINLTHGEIEFAYKVWNNNRASIVGWSSRHHSMNVAGQWIYSNLKTCQASMVITNAAFFHKYYSYLYTYWMMEGVRLTVKEKMNCEDIALNFLVAHISRKPPIKVGERRNIQSQSKEGLSKIQGHYVERDHCMQQFSVLFGYMPLLHTLYRVEPILSEEGKCFEGL